MYFLAKVAMKAAHIIPALRGEHLLALLGLHREFV